MKSILCFLMLVSGAASATVAVTALQPPVLPTAPQHGCAAVGFSADDTVHGFCYTQSWGPACSGRGCQPTRIYQFYDTKWAPDTSVISATHCGQWTSHPPGLSAWVYDAGYDASTCYKAPYPGTGPVQIESFPFFNGAEQYAYYLSASADGVYGLWDAFGESWIGEF